MEKVLIVGGGKFGEKALSYARNEHYEIIIIDKDSDCLCSQHATETFLEVEEFRDNIKKMEKGGVLFLNMDITSTYELVKFIDFKYIIPVVPEHLMAHLIKCFLKASSIELEFNHEAYANFLSKVNKDLLLSANKEEGIACLSYAKKGEICPENCIGPEDYCPNFNREKPITITNYLRNLFGVEDLLKLKKNGSFSFYNINESKQLKAGLGGLLGEDVQRTFSFLQNYKEQFLDNDLQLFIATTCNCHGVIHFFKKNNFKT